MRRAAATDANQDAIVRELRRCGCSVTILAKVGEGVPDLLVGLRGNNFLLEVKDGKKPPSQRRLTEDQEKWHAEWRGTAAVVENVNDALKAVGLVR